jgi:hypothetical protein
MFFLIFIIMIFIHEKKELNLIYTQVKILDNDRKSVLYILSQNV